MSIRLKTYLLAAFFLAVLFWVYSNHFRNGFQFDDFHGIVNNGYIMDIGNVFLFFTDGTTSTTNPSNQSYRPMNTLMNALDYRIAGGMDPLQFHISIFFWYLILGVLLFFFVKKCLQLSNEHPWNPLVAIFMVAWYMLHTANAETINYIGARSDGFSTLCIVASLVIYQSRIGRKYYLYLLTMLIGIYTKQTGVMFAGLLFCYIYLFEENGSLRDLGNRTGLDAALRALKKSAPALIVGGGIFFINMYFMTSETNTKWNTEASKLEYFSTQWYVVLHYLGNFILPTDLSADPDLELISPIYDKRILAGFLAISLMLYAGVKMSDKRETKLIAFGILWFFIALIPTSSILPRFQIANDHRTFFSNIGLIFSAGWWLALWLQRKTQQPGNHRVLTYSFATMAVVIICSYGYGAHLRNKVWSSGESLWKDVAEKSPRNGRGLMNYGLVKMENGQYAEALVLFKEAEKLLPNWSYLHINLAILKNAMGDPAEAEAYFQRAMQSGRNNAEVYYFYGRWLHGQGRDKEAVELLEEGISLSPAHLKINSLLMSLKQNAEAGAGGEEGVAYLERLSIAEPSAANYLNLSLAYYKGKKYAACISACRSALEIEPSMAEAYNNICSAYNQLQEWDKAVDACEKALALSADFELARNNLKWAEEEIQLRRDSAMGKKE